MIERPVLLDTCAMLWFVDGTLPADMMEALNTTESGEALISPISAWELGLLTSRGRLTLSRSVADWFGDLLETGVALAAMPPAILIAASFLPGEPPKDPADRIIAATARAFGYRVMTRDRGLLAYGESGHLETLAC
ncbi:MAG: type II toxin-antitoxin system VapC family toxin [Caulobacteraceae bacterium]